MTRQEEARQLLARLSELAQDDTLSEEDATEMVAGLVGALVTMQENPAWQRVMAKAGARSSGPRGPSLRGVFSVRGEFRRVVGVRRAPFPGADAG